MINGNKIVTNGNKLLANSNKTVVNGNRLFANSNKTVVKGNRLFANGNRLVAKPNFCRKKVNFSLKNLAIKKKSLYRRN